MNNNYSVPGKFVKLPNNPDLLAFVPNPLPPILAVDWDIAEKLAQAERALGKLCVLERAISPQIYTQLFMRMEAIKSSEIEGLHTTVERLVTFSRASSEVENDTLEVDNYIRALNYGLQMIQKGRLVNNDLLCELHKILLTGVRGETEKPGKFRNEQNYILPSGTKNIRHAKYIPPPVSHMHENLRNIEEYTLSSTQPLPDLIRLTIIHYQLEAIHPFMDGNGRIGRLFITLLLVQWGILPAPILNISGYFIRQRQQYYDLIKEIEEKGNWQAWIRFFLVGLTEQANEIVGLAYRLHDLRTEWLEKLENDRSSGNLTFAESKIIDELFVTPTISANEILRKKELHGISSHPGAMKILNRFSKLGILEPDGRARDMYFRAYALYNIVDSV